MLSGSKQAYSKKHPDSVVFFNANIYDSEGEKLWYGDIDLTKDGKKLNQIVNKIGEKIYVTREQPWRFLEFQGKSVLEALQKDCDKLENSMVYCIEPDNV
jgi:hypothetical protein